MILEESVIYGYDELLVSLYYVFIGPEPAIGNIDNNAICRGNV